MRSSLLSVRRRHCVQCRKLTAIRKRVMMRTILAAMTALSLAPVNALAQVPECPAIENDLDRLACYDKASGRTPTVTAESAKGSWSVQTKRSEFEDTTDVYMSVQSKAPVACNMFGSHQPASLYLRCQENTTAIYIATNCHLASGFQGYGEVDVRVTTRKQPRCLWT